MNVPDILLWLVFFLVLGTTIPVGLAYLAEWYTRKAYQSYARFQIACQNLADYEKDIGKAAMDWPIYVRPVLFTTVDKSTQRTFGMAQRALMEAQKIAQTFPSVPMRPAEIWQAFSPFKSAERIMQCDSVIQRETEFEGWLVQLAEEKESLNQHHNEEKQTLANVRGELETLKARLSAAENKVASQAHGKTFNETIGWVINYAQIGTHASEERLGAPRQKGLLNYAIAATFIRLTNYLLDHFDLSIMDVSFSEKFILDRFESHLKDFEINLRKVIEAKTKVDEDNPAKEIPPIAVNQESLSGAGTKFTAQTMLTARQATYQQTTNAIDTWEEAASLDNRLSVLNQKLQQASSSFSFFRKVHTIYLDLNKKIVGTNIPRLQEESLKLESECEKYWGAFDTTPAHWKEALRGLALPQVEFAEAREFFITQIDFHLKPDVKIKQSEMTMIISKMNFFWVRVENGKRSFEKLSGHLKVHKDAEVIVRARLADNGSTGKQVRKMESIKADYSKPHQETCVKYRREYAGFIGRAGKVAGANYPAMIKDLDIFEEKKCQSLIAEHNAEINALHQQCDNNAVVLRTHKTRIEQFKGYVPRIKYNFQGMEAKLTSVLQQKYRNNKNYQWLQDYLKEINGIMGNAEQATNELNTQWKTFTDAEKNAFNLVAQYRTALSNYQQDFSMGWEWVKKETAGLVEKALRDVEKTSAPLSRNRDPQNNLSIEDALKNCQKVMREIESVTSSNLGKFSEIQQKQVEYSQRYNALMNMVDKPIPPIYYMLKLKPKVPEKMKELCALATQVNDRMQVRSLLNSAEAYFGEQLTEADAEKIIQNFYVNNQGLLIGTQNNQANAVVTNVGRDSINRGNYPGTA